MSFLPSVEGTQRSDCYSFPMRKCWRAPKPNLIRSAIDTSDGVMACIQLLGREAEQKVGFELDEYLLHEALDPEVKTIATQLGYPPAQFFLNAGHDWEIVLTVDETDFDT